MQGLNSELKSQAALMDEGSQANVRLAAEGAFALAKLLGKGSDRDLLTVKKKGGQEKDMSQGQEPTATVTRKAEPEQLKVVRNSEIQPELSPETAAKGALESLDKFLPNGELTEASVEIDGKNYDVTKYKGGRGDKHQRISIADPETGEKISYKGGKMNNISASPEFLGKVPDIVNSLTQEPVREVEIEATEQSIAISEIELDSKISTLENQVERGDVSPASEIEARDYDRQAEEIELEEDRISEAVSSIDADTLEDRAEQIEVEVDTELDTPAIESVATKLPTEPDPWEPETPRVEGAGTDVEVLQPLPEVEESEAPKKPLLEEDLSEQQAKSEPGARIESDLPKKSEPELLYGFDADNNFAAAPLSQEDAKAILGLLEGREGETLEGDAGKNLLIEYGNVKLFETDGDGRITYSAFSDPNMLDKMKSRDDMGLGKLRDYAQRFARPQQDPTVSRQDSKEIDPQSDLAKSLYDRPPDSQPEPTVEEYLAALSDRVLKPDLADRPSNKRVSNHDVNGVKFNRNAPNKEGVQTVSMKFDDKSKFQTIGILDREGNFTANPDLKNSERVKEVVKEILNERESDLTVDLSEYYDPKIDFGEEDRIPFKERLRQSIDNVSRLGSEILAERFAELKDQDAATINHNGVKFDRGAPDKNGDRQVLMDLGATSEPIGTLDRQGNFTVDPDLKKSPYLGLVDERAANILDERDYWQQVDREIAKSEIDSDPEINFGTDDPVVSFAEPERDPELNFGEREDEGLDR